jgi:mannose-6-phosphate isomerase-like protein (cupin superfamily)
VETAFLEAGIPLQQRVGAHLHLTPPQGVAKTPHYHTHDNWIVQVRGAKRWRLYGCREEFPLEVQRGEVSRDRLPPLRRTVHLEAGQALYVPRGHYHEAQAVDAPSLHVTLDLTPVSWVDLLCRGARRETALRQALPRRSPPREGESSLKAGWKRRLDGLLRHRGEIDALCRELREGFLESLDPMPGKEGFKH